MLWEGSSLTHSLQAILAFRNPRSLTPFRASRARKTYVSGEGRCQGIVREPGGHNSVGTDRVHPRVLRELADVTVRPLSSVFDMSQ